MYTVHTAHDTCSDIILIFPKSRDNKFREKSELLKYKKAKVMFCYHK